MQTETEEEEAKQEGPVCYLSDLLADNRQIFQWAGISLGDQTAILLQKSLKELAARTQASKLRFWGKVFGTQKDYYVAEGIADSVLFN